MLNLICMLAVKFACEKHNTCDAEILLRGHILSETKSQYIADFSVWAKKDGILGDYTRIAVSKSACELTGGYNAR